MSRQLAPPPSVDNREKRRERLAYAAWYEAALVVLSAVWLVLVALEFVIGERTDMTIALYAVWAIFVVDFIAKLIMANRKLDYLRANMLTAIALIVPALRVFRLARLLRLTRSTQLVKVFGSINRAIHSLGRTLGYRGLPYVALLTSVVTLLSAAAIYSFERPPSGSIASYGDAIWFTSMIMTTMGSSYWPQSPEGRILCFVLSLYAFGVFGYFTAALASFFVGSNVDKESQLLREIREIKLELEKLRKNSGT